MIIFESTGQYVTHSIALFLIGVGTTLCVEAKIEEKRMKRFRRKYS